jgi:hypothetical protein
MTGRSGRIDLLVVPTGVERMAVVVEIKSTDWDVRGSHRVRPNARSHIRQLQGYLDAIIDELGVPGGYVSAAGVLLYPRRPADPVRAELITAMAEAEALMVVWHDETTWKD